MKVLELTNRDLKIKLVCRTGLQIRRSVKGDASYQSDEWRPGSTGAASGQEEILHVQGQRNPSKAVGTEIGHQRADRLKPQSQKTNQSDYMDHSLV